MIEKISWDDDTLYIGRFLVDAQDFLYIIILIIDILCNFILFNSINHLITFVNSDI